MLIFVQYTPNSTILQPFFNPEFHVNSAYFSGIKATDKGYDGVMGVKISHPSVVDGGVEVVYGNGYRTRNAE
jgi:hypothetical protein